MTTQHANEETAKVLDAIGDTHVLLIDAVHGYDVMLEKAEPEITDTIRSIRQTNERQAGELASFLTSQGRHPSEDGSFMSTVHEGVVRTRAFFTDIDEDVLPSVADGERWLVSSYDDALEALAKHTQALPAATFDAAHTLLIKHRSELEDLIRGIETRHRAMAS
ncbi:DUF2383 domain-containing protein [Hoeflea olei]|uniref:DUF2383 domain-containing protein n=1 Tax=Hoeflea olei TaxID=1480615 RepID=A0A1C1YTU0_9HYPH|nr:DUF2383 domain-containing protein [Hoeflea olei]OCW56943.1 hypothetical protein AWJ14_07230 [Hoeflea olei]